MILAMLKTERQVQRQPSNLTHQVSLNSNSPSVYDRDRCYSNMSAYSRISGDRNVFCAFFQSSYRFWHRANLFRSLVPVPATQGTTLKFNHRIW